MTKWLLGPTLLLAIVGLAQSPSPAPSSTPPKQDLASEIAEIRAHVQFLEQEINNDIPILNERTLDLNERLKHFEAQEGKGPSRKAMLKFQAELNDVDARVAQLERPEPEDEAK